MRRQPVEQRRAARHHDRVHQIAVALDDLGKSGKVTVKDRLLAGLQSAPLPRRPARLASRWSAAGVMSRRRANLFMRRG